ncbi:hypothetical protein [Streptomyces sp. NPDC054787]
MNDWSQGSQQAGGARGGAARCGRAETQACAAGAAAIDWLPGRPFLVRTLSGQISSGDVTAAR